MQVHHDKSCLLQLYHSFLFFYIFYLFLIFNFAIVSFVYVLFSFFIFFNVCTRPNGVTFTVTKENTKNVPHMKEGDVVTFQYDNYTRGGRRGGGEEGEDERERGMQAPVNAVIFRDRRDLSWLDVVRNFFLSLPSSRSLNGINFFVFFYCYLLLFFKVIYFVLGFK